MQSSSYASMAQRQRRWRADIRTRRCKAATFVAGANPRSIARLQVTSKPLDARDDRVQQVISRLPPPNRPWRRFRRGAGVSGRRGILTIDTRVSRAVISLPCGPRRLVRSATGVKNCRTALHGRYHGFPRVSGDWQIGLAARVGMSTCDASRA